MEDYKIKLAPIVLFTYNRPHHTQQTVEALQQNELASESDLIVFSDFAKNDNVIKGVEETRRYIKTISGFKSVTIIERSSNYGLAKNIIKGVTEVVNQYGRIIVLEDDLITSPFFLKFINEALELYEKEERVISVMGYVYPCKKSLPDTFFIKGADCLGWATWKRGWDLFNPNGRTLLDEIKRKHLEKEFDFSSSYPYIKMLENQVNGKVGSWAIRWYASAFINNKLTLYPKKSLIFHNGSDGSGTNCTVVTSEFDVELTKEPIPVYQIEVEESKYARKRFIFYFRFTIPYKRIEGRIKQLFKF